MALLQSESEVLFSLICDEDWFRCRGSKVNRLGIRAIHIVHPVYCPVSYFNITSNSSCQSCVQYSVILVLALQPPRATVYSYGMGSYDGSAAQDCTGDCVQCYGTASNQCYHCSPPKLLYADGTCQASCQSPLEQFGENSAYKCIQPCAPNQYMLWNETCADSCDYPFIFGVDSNSRKTCDFPCALSINSFLYQNGSCLSTCPSPHSQINENNYRYCNPPCDTSSFFYQNGSCQANCPSSTFVQIIEGDLKLCNFNPQNDDSKNNPNSLIDTLRSINNAAALGANIWRKSNPYSALMTALAKIVKYVKNLDVPILDSVREELNSQASSTFFSFSLTFTIEMPAKLEACFTRHSLPPIFSESSFHSSFFVNHWGSISTYFILFVFGCVVSFLDKIIQNYWGRKRILVAIFKRLKVISQWNFVLFTLFNTYDDLTFFPILEFMTLEFDSIASVVSFCSCLIMMLVAILMLVKVFAISKDIIKTKKQVIDESTQDSKTLLYEKWKNYQVLYAGYNDSTFLTQSFLLLSTIRIIVCYLFVGLLYRYPLVQAIHITLMSVLMMIYILKLRPIKDPLNFFVTLIYETLALMVNTCVLILAICDALNTLSAHMQSNLSYTILILNTTINTFGSILTWVYVATGAWAAYKASRKFGLSGITTWLNVPLASYQNPAMDFDEHSNDLAIEPLRVDSKDIKEYERGMNTKLSHPRRDVNGDSESPPTSRIHEQPDQSSMVPIQLNFDKLNYQKLAFGDHEKSSSDVFRRSRFSRNTLSYSTNFIDASPPSNSISGRKYDFSMENNKSLFGKNLVEAEKEGQLLQLQNASSIDESPKRSNFGDQLLYRALQKNNAYRSSRFVHQLINGFQEPIKTTEKIESNTNEVKDKEMQGSNYQITDLSSNTERINTTRRSGKVSYRTIDYDDESRLNQSKSEVRMSGRR